MLGFAEGTELEVRRAGEADSAGGGGSGGDPASEDGRDTNFGAADLLPDRMRSQAISSPSY